MKEIWKQIPNSVYSISNTGKVRNNKTTRILKPIKDKDGYSLVGLVTTLGNKQFKIHRLVAQAFIPNPDNKPQVNHINGDKSDNRVINLEWNTCKENINHAISFGLIKTRTPIYCSTNNKIYSSVREAGRELNIHPGYISQVCKGTYAQAKGYNFEYIERG